MCSKSWKNGLNCAFCINNVDILRVRFKEFNWIPIIFDPKHKTDKNEVIADDDLDNFQQYIHSSCASLHKSTEEEIFSVSKDALMEDSKNLFRYFRQEFNCKKFESIYIWNGRRASEGPVIEAAKSCNLNYFTVMTGGHDGKISISFNHLFHDIEKTEIKIKAFKNLVSKKYLADEAEKYFSFARGSTSEKMVGFTDFSKKFSREATKNFNYIIFMGTYYEFYGLSGWNDKEFGSHNDALLETVAKIKEYDNQASICVRWHPNTRSANKKDLFEIRRINTKLDLMGVKAFEPSSNFNSYGLFHRNAVVISIGSSMAIEASAAGIPKVGFIGRNYFQRLKSHSWIKSKEQLENFLRNAPEPYDRSDAILYAAYVRNMGEEQFDQVINPKTVLPPYKLTPKLMIKYIMLKLYFHLYWKFLKS